MKSLILLVLAGLATATNTKEGDRIFSTEQECDRIYKLNENWGPKNFHEQAAQYVDLYFICSDGLNEDKYKYIDDNMVDLSWYPGENDKFPVETSEGQKFVSKPPPRKPKDKESMKRKLSNYVKETGGMINPVRRMMSIQSKMGQQIVDKQVECDILALYLLKNPEVKDSEKKHTDCVNELNCIKEGFMAQHGFTRKEFPENFPILYKQRGTMVKTPPLIENALSVCETPSPGGSKSELEKWLNGIEVIGEKISDVGEAGTDFIEKLVRKGMHAGKKILTKEELDNVLADADSVEILDTDETDDKNDENTFSVYEDLIKEKLKELEAKGVKIVDKTKPAIDNLASVTGDKLSEIEENMIKPVVHKTVHGLGIAEKKIKDKSKDAFEEVKGGIAITGSVAEKAETKVKEESSMLVKKIKDNLEKNKTSNEDMDGATVVATLIDRLIHPEYLPENHADTHPSGLLHILKDMGNHEDRKDERSVEELEKSLKELKKKTREKIDSLHLSQEDVRKSANAIKGVMHILLAAAGHGYGPAKDMNEHEIEKAKSVVDELVNYATAEIINHDNVKKEVDDEGSSSDESDMKATKAIKAIDAKTHKDEVKTLETDEAIDILKTQETRGEIAQEEELKTPVTDDVTISLERQEDTQETPDGTTRNEEVKKPLTDEVRGILKTQEDTKEIPDEIQAGVEAGKGDGDENIDIR